MFIFFEFFAAVTKRKNIVLVIRGFLFQMLHLGFFFSLKLQKMTKTINFFRV